MVRSFAHRVDTLVSHFDEWQRRRPRTSFALAVLKKYSDDEAGHRAALLAYYGFLSLFPLLLVLTTLLHILLRNNSHLGNQIVHTAVDYFPAIGRDLQQNIRTIDKTGPALVIGIALTLFGARGAADVLRSSLDHIWQVPYARRSRLPGSLFRSLTIIIIAGLGLTVAPVILGYALAFAHNYILGLLSPLCTVLVLFWMLVFIIKVGTSTRQPLRRIWFGALITVVSLTLLQSLGGYIMARELQRLNSLYGIFALVLGLIFWLYLQTQILLLALEIDSVRAFKLWPRSFRRPLTPADQAAFQLYSDRARFHDEY